MDTLELIITFIVAGAGACLGSYLKKKGENLATSEDIGMLVNQVSAVTQATKEIEDKISSVTWRKQKLWEARRDVCFEALREMMNLESSALSAMSSYEAWRSVGRTDEQWKAYEEGREKYREAHETFSRASIAARTIGSERLNIGLLTVGNRLGDLQTQILLKPMTELLLEIRNAVVAIVEVESIIRTELDIDVATPQSSGSSAASSPD